MAKKAKKQMKATKAKKQKKQDKVEEVVRANCSSFEVILALRAYFGGVKTGLGKRKDDKARRLRSEININEGKLGKMEKRLRRNRDQSRGVTVLFTRQFDKANARLKAAGLPALL